MDESAPCNNEKDTTSGSSKSLSSFKKLIFRVDTEALLKEMMEEAGEVVGTVVELTNQAWAERQEHMAAVTNKNEAAADASLSASESANESATLMKSNKDGAGASAAGPKLGVVKTVSEPEFFFPQSNEAIATKNRSQEKVVVDQDVVAANNVRSWQRRFNGDNSLTSVSYFARDSDEENTNPGISAEKASHIIDYVFDEIDDVGFNPSPPPLKKTRLESS